MRLTIVNLIVMNKNIFSTAEVAKILGISRIAVFKKIKSGEIKAQKIGRSYIIHKVDLPIQHGGELTEEKKDIIKEAVKKTIKDYGETLKLLGKE